VLILSLNLKLAAIKTPASEFVFKYILVHAEEEIIVSVLILGSEVVCRRSGVHKKKMGRKGKSWVGAATFTF